MSSPDVIPHDRWATAIGLQITEGPDGVTGRLRVTDRLLDASGALHHGILATMGETLASVAGALMFRDHGQVVGVSNTTDTFTRVVDGELHATTTQLLFDDGAQVWRVEVRDAADALVSVSQVRLANLPSADGLGRT